MKNKKLFFILTIFFSMVISANFLYINASEISFDSNMLLADSDRIYDHHLNSQINLPPVENKKNQKYRYVAEENTLVLVDDKFINEENSLKNTNAILISGNDEILFPKTIITLEEIRNEQGSFSQKNNTFSEADRFLEEIRNNQNLDNSQNQNLDNSQNQNLSNSQNQNNYINDAPSPDNLFKAVRDGNVDLLVRLLNQGINLNIVDENANNALILAILNGKNEIINILLNAKFNLDHRNSDGVNALFLALLRENLSLVRSLLQAGANPNIPNTNGITPLMLAAIKDDSKFINLLLDYNANKAAGDKNGKTALMYAIESENTSAIKYLSPRDPKDILKDPFSPYKGGM